MTWSKTNRARWKGRAVRYRATAAGIEYRRDREHEQSAVFVDHAEVVRLALKLRRQAEARAVREAKRLRKRDRKQRAVVDEEDAFFLAHLASPPLEAFPLDPMLRRQR